MPKEAEDIVGVVVHAEKQGFFAAIAGIIPVEQDRYATVVLDGGTNISTERIAPFAAWAIGKRQAVLEVQRGRQWIDNNPNGFASRLRNQAQCQRPVVYQQRFGEYVVSAVGLAIEGCRVAVGQIEMTAIQYQVTGNFA